MPKQIQEREMSVEERQLLREVSVSGLNWRQLLFVAILAWVGTTIMLSGALAIVGALIQVTFGGIAWLSAMADWIVPFSAFAAAIFLFGNFAPYFIPHGKENRNKTLQADLDAGRVLEEEYEFTAAKRLQEPEHGGLIYFLLTTDSRVLVLYDTESQDIGVRGKDPLSSSFRPCRRLTMVRAPQAGFALSKNFSGETLDAGDPLELTVPPKRWPADEEFCDVHWENLEATYCR